MTEETLTQLGREARGFENPEQAVLERVANPQAGALYLARFTAPEFTSLCPVTGQPDFAHLVIDYAPGDWLIESKSLKLYLSSFRNHGAFHEDCTVAIGRRIVATAEPVWLRIGGFWVPRGGLPVEAFCQSWPAPAGPGAAPREMSSGRAARRRRACGCRTQSWRPIAAGPDGGREQLYFPNIWFGP